MACRTSRSHRGSRSRLGVRSKTPAMQRRDACSFWKFRLGHHHPFILRKLLGLRSFLVVLVCVKRTSFLFSLLTTKQPCTNAGQAFFFGFFLSPFVRGSFCYCALTRPVPPMPVPGQQDNDCQKEARDFFAPPLSCLFRDLPITH